MSRIDVDYLSNCKKDAKAKHERCVLAGDEKVGYTGGEAMSVLLAPRCLWGGNRVLSF